MSFRFEQTAEKAVNPCITAGDMINDTPLQHRREAQARHTQGIVLTQPEQHLLPYALRFRSGRSQIQVLQQVKPAPHHLHGGIHGGTLRTQENILLIIRQLKK